MESCSVQLGIWKMDGLPRVCLMITHPIYAVLHSPRLCRSLKQSTRKGTRWLSANGKGGMGSETQNSSDEKFVIMGSRKYCPNFKAGNDDGYLRAHHLTTDRDQADITADGKPYWTENWTKKKGSGGGGLGQPNLSDHSSEPHSERLTTFYLGLLY